MRLFDKIGWKIFLTLFISYLFFGQYDTGNQKSLLDLTLAMGFQNKLNIDDYYNSSLETKTFDIAYYNGNYYSDKAIGLPIIGSLAVKILKPFFGTDPALTKNYAKLHVLIFLLIALTSSLFSALTAVLIYNISRFFTRKNKIRLLITFTYGFSPLVFPYAVRYHTHATGTFFAFLCFYLIFKMKKMKHFSVKTAFFAGFSGGLAIITEYPSIIAVLMCLIILIFQRKIKYIIFFLAGTGLITLLGVLYNFLVYSHPLHLGYFHIIPIWASPYTGNNLLKLYSQQMCYNTNYFYMIHNVIQTLFLPFKGMFFYFPILIFSAIGLFFMRKKYKIESFCILIIFLTVIIWNSTRAGWWCHEGLLCRRFLIFVPLLMMPLFYSFKKFNYKLLSSLSIASILIGLLTIQRMDRLGGFVYGIKPTVIKYSFLNAYKVIAFPLTNYYLPLFVKFGPSSDLINKIVGFQIPIFLNLIALIFIIYLIWMNKINEWVTKHKKIAYATVFIFLLLVFIRVFFDIPISAYAEKTYTNYFIEKYFEDYDYDSWTSFFLPDKKIIDSIKKKYAFNIPYILKVDSLLSVINEKNKNWYYPNSKPSAARDHNYMYQDGTIVIDAKKETNVSLDIIVRSFYKQKTLQVIFNDILIESFLLNEDSKNFSLPLVLKRGTNTIKFHVPEGCTLERDKYPGNMDFVRHIRCKSLDFDKIDIYQN